MLSNIQQQFFRPIDNSQLTLFRIFVGILMAVESFGAIATGWVRRTLIEPQFTFNFIGLDWLQPLPGNGMYFYFILMGIASLLVMMGYRYRASATVLALMWSGVYFMQKTSYNNHYYLMVLLLWVMVLLPAHLSRSLDARRTDQEVHTCWQGIRWFFILQVWIVFTYGALAKLYPGWWSGDFIQQSFARKTNYWLIGPLLGEEWFQMFITYSGIIFDGLIVPALLWKRTRILAFIGLLIFNLFNSVIFQIGVFPYTMIALSIFFFDPETIRRIFFRKKTIPDLGTPLVKKKWALNVFLIYFIIQLALPLRHHFIPGDVNWREEGHRLSWRMMLRSKSGYLQLEARNPKTQEKWRIKHRDFLSKKQIGRVATKPDFLWQYIQRLKKEYAQQGIPDIEIYCKKSSVRLNRNDKQPLFASDVDLAKVDWNYFGRNEWVLDEGIAND